MKTLLQWGSEYVVDKKERPCMICGKPTKFIEIFFEAPICCAKCQEEADKGYIEWASAPIEGDF